jgi:hypothetical protein
VQDTWKSIWITKKDRGLSVNLPLHLLLCTYARNRQGSLPAKISGEQGLARCSGGKQRGDRGSLGTCSPSWIWTEATRLAGGGGPATGAGGVRNSVLQQNIEKGREIEIRWGRPPNVHGNGKTERKRQDERDGVLTFGQR